MFNSYIKLPEGNMVEHMLVKQTSTIFWWFFATQKNCKFGVDPIVLTTLPQNYKYFEGEDDD